MKHTLAANASHESDDHLRKWIPFIGPGAAVVFLCVVYVILASLFS